MSQSEVGMNRAIFLAMIVLLLVACGPTTHGPRVQRLAADEQVDLSGRWNDTDSNLVSERMVRDLLSRPWLDEYRKTSGRKPTLGVGRVRNKSSEHIPTDTFVKDLERELINSGEVRFVASHAQRKDLRREKRDQARSASLDSQKAMGKELGADFLMVGQINSMEDRTGGTVLKYFQVELELIDIESGEKVWMGQKKIKKIIERGEWDY